MLFRVVFTLPARPTLIVSSVLYFLEALSFLAVQLYRELTINLDGGMVSSFSTLALAFRLPGTIGLIVVFF